jgi:hypothetical protein
MTKNETIVYLISIGYSVSQQGVLLKNGSKTQTTSKNSNGYLNIKTKIRGKNILADIHRIQAYQKYGEKLFEEGVEVRHLDNNKLNNSYDNIAIGTPRENMLDTPLWVRLKRSRLGAAYVRRLTYQDANEIRAKRNAGYTYKELCLEYKVCKSLVSYIINNRTYNDSEHTTL